MKATISTFLSRIDDCDADKRILVATSTAQDKNLPAASPAQCIAASAAERLAQIHATRPKPDQEIPLPPWETSSTMSKEELDEWSSQWECAGGNYQPLTGIGVDCLTRLGMPCAMLVQDVHAIFSDPCDALALCHSVPKLPKS